MVFNASVNNCKKIFAEFWRALTYLLVMYKHKYEEWTQKCRPTYGLKVKYFKQANMKIA